MLLAVVAVAAALVAALGAGDERPPATGAAALVPADALAYVNLSIDPTRPAVRRALALRARLPQLAALSPALQSEFATITGSSGSPRFDEDIRPWMGNEAALAVLDTSSSAASVLILVAVRKPALAQGALQSAGAAPVGAYRGRTLWRFTSGSEATLAGHFLLVGTDPSLRSAIDVGAGAVPSLAGAGQYRRATAGEPDGRVLDIYLSADGVRRLLEPRHGLAGAIGVLLDQPALDAVAASVSAEAPGLRIQLHSALSGGPASDQSQPESREPTLQKVIPAGWSLMFDTTGLSREAGRVLAAGAAAGVAGRAGPLLSRLAAALSAEGVNVSALVSLFDGETAVALGPAGGHSPSAVIVSRTQDPASARTTLAGLALPLAQLFQSSGSSPGQAPVLTEHQVGSVAVQEISLTPGLHLDYAVTNRLVVLSTQLKAVADVIAHAHALGDEPAYQAVARGPTQVRSLLFLDFSQLLNLGEQTGLTQGARYRALTADLQRIRTAGLESTGGEADTNAEMLLQIS